MHTLNPLRELTDEHLMLHVQCGDRAALHVLFERYYGPLRQYFTRMLWRDSTLADDATQQLFLQVAQNAGSYRAGSPVRTWLYSCAHNLCKNAYRRAGRVEMHPLDHLAGEATPTDPLPLPDDRLHHADFQQAVMAALDELGPDQRATFVMRYLQDLPLAEIAEALGVPLGTVKSRLHSTLRFLSNTLQAYHPTKPHYPL